MKQVAIRDNETGLIHGGILTDSGDVICACCGGLIEKDELGTEDDSIAEIVKIYENWIDFSDSILD